MNQQNPTATPPTVESLTAELAAARTQHAEKDQLIAALQADKDQLMGVIDGQGATIGELEAQVSTLQAKPATEPRFTLGKKTYGVGVSTFTYKRVTYTAAHLLEDKELQKKLVDAQMGFLTLIQE